MGPPGVGGDPLAPRENRVVIVVDDEREVLSSLQRLLRNEPYTLQVTESPDEALSWLEDRDVALVISDQRMPRMLGTDLLEEVGKRSPATARILMTGFPGSPLLLRGMEGERYRLLYKPWDGDTLRRMIRSILEERG